MLASSLEKEQSCPCMYSSKPLAVLQKTVPLCCWRRILTKALLVLIQAHPLKKLMLIRCHLKYAEKGKCYFSLETDNRYAVGFKCRKKPPLGAFWYCLVLLGKPRLWHPPQEGLRPTSTLSPSRQLSSTVKDQKWSWMEEDEDSWSHSA